MRSPAELTVAFHDRGLRVTPQRQLLFRLLHGNESHPSAEVLYHAAVELMPGLSLRTVYQTLNDLASLGEVRSCDFGTGAARFDPNVEDHHHLVCERCGSVRDVHLAGTARPEPDATPDGFRLSRTDVVFRGVCAACTDAAHGTDHPSTNHHQHKER